MDDQVKDILLYEIRENRKEIRKNNERIASMDKNIFSNKIKLSLFIGSVSVGFSFVSALILEKLKSIFF